MAGGCVTQKHSLHIVSCMQQILSSEEALSRPEPAFRRPACWTLKRPAVSATASAACGSSVPSSE